MQQAAAAPCDRELRGSSWRSACRYLVGHVHSHAHRYMTCSRPWTVDHGTARRALFCRLLFKHAGLQLPRCRLCFPTKQDADDAAPFDLDATRDSFFSSRGGSSRFVLSRSITVKVDSRIASHAGLGRTHWRWPPALIIWQSSPHLA